MPINPRAIKSSAEQLLQAIFRSFDEQLSKDFEYVAQNPRELHAALLQKMLAAFPVVFEARGSADAAVLALLFNAATAGRLAALASGETQPPEALDEGQIEDLENLAQQAFQAARSTLAGGADANQPLSVVVLTDFAEQSDELLARLGDGAIAIRFACNAPPDFSGESVLLLGQTLTQGMTSDDTFEADNAAAALSEADMKDILSGMDSPGAADRPAPEATPQNLEMVFDIRLTATARLGRVELPLSEILELGPGSIIEVGHLVDEPVDLLINDKLIARGDVVVVDEKFGLRITEIISTKERIESLR